MNCYKQKIILEMNNNLWLATFTDNKEYSDLFPTGIPLPYNGDSTMDQVALELINKYPNHSLIYKQTYVGSDISASIDCLTPYPSSDEIISRPWLVECYDETMLRRVSFGVFSNKKTALNAARYCAEPQHGGYSYIKVSSTPDFIVTHHSPISL